MPTKLCKICSDDYNEETKTPRVLSCGHSYCTSCISILMNTEDAACPECRSKIAYDSVDAVPVNYTLISIIQEMNSASHCNDVDEFYSAGPCTSHGGAPKYCWCSTCKVWICENCKTTTHPVPPLGTCIVLEESAAATDLKQIIMEDNQAFRHCMRKFQEHIIENKAKIERTILDINLKKEETENDLMKLHQKQKYLVEAEKTVVEWKNKLQEKLALVDSASTTCDVVSAVQTHNNQLQKAHKWLEGNKNMSQLCMQNSLLRMLPCFLDFYAVKCVGGKSMWTPLTIENDQLYVHSFTNQTPNFGAQIVSYQDVFKLKNQKQQIALEISVSSMNVGMRVIITLKTNNDFSKNMVAAVTGENGIWLKGTKLRLNYDKELIGGEYEKDGDMCLEPVIDNINKTTCKLIKSTPGSIYGILAEKRDNDNLTDDDESRTSSEPTSKFGINLDKQSDNFSEEYCFGHVAEGLDQLLSLSSDDSMVIKDCAVLIPISSFVLPL